MASPDTKRALLERIVPGLTGTAEIVVGPEHTAPFVGSGKIAVLATPVMINLIEAAALFCCLILFLRAMAIEPFGVPTGSMAPTLTGNHRCAYCPRCGYPVRLGEPMPTHRGVTRPWCANRGSTLLVFDNIPEIAGDRLLVDKNIFSLRRPRRWEVAVFRCPCDQTEHDDTTFTRFHDIYDSSWRIHLPNCVA